MLPSAVIPNSKFCHFYEKDGVLYISTYPCNHRRQWIDDTRIWLNDHGMEWNMKTPWCPRVEISDKNMALMFRLAWSGGFSDKCGC